MTINRTRAKLIHECLFYAMWGTLVAFVVSFAADVPSILRSALIVVAVALLLLWALMPPVPAQRARKRPRKAASPRPGRKRKSRHWSF